MAIKEQVCFVAVCDRCGEETSPPAKTREGALQVAEFWDYEVRSNGELLCRSCVHGRYCQCEECAQRDLEARR